MGHRTNGRPKAYKVVLWHGPKYHSDRQTRIDKKSRFENLPTGESRPVPRPRQRNLHLTPAPEPQQSAVIFDYRVIAELQKRGVGEADARTLIGKLLSGQPILDQLEYLDFQIEQARGTRREIKNQPGFYIERLRANVSIPLTFQTSQARKTRQEAELAHQKALQQATEKRQAAEDAIRQAAEDELDRLKDQNPDRYQEIYNQAKANLITQFPNMAVLFKINPNANALHAGAIRARMRSLLKPSPGQAELPMTTEPQPGRSQAAALRVEPRPFDLQALLTTLQLPSPDPTAAEPEYQEPALRQKSALPTNPLI